jgi:choline dehydrogenase-like flavoprotein
VPEQETPMFQTRGEAPLRGSSTPDKPFGFHDATIDGGWQVPGEPYVNATQEDSGRFDWWRSRMLGGRTNHWGRYSFRNGPYDFKPRSRDGLGFDWPLTYDELAPYYDKVEMLVGVYGSNEGLENTPDSSPACLLPPPAPHAHELYSKKICSKLGLPVVPIHRAVLSAKQDFQNLPAKLHPGNKRAQEIISKHMQLRAACFWATPCGRGCSTRANYQSTTVHLPPALDTGNLDIIPNAMVREVTVDQNGPRERSLKRPPVTLREWPAPDLRSAPGVRIGRRDSAARGT